MRTIAILTVFMASAVIGQEAKKAAPAAPAQGKIERAKRTELRRFRAPVTTPPAQRPPHRPGHSWHWHRHYGWILLPVASAPATVLLPPTYQLPAAVVTYQQQGTPVEVLCPHCGRPLTVYVP